MAHEIAEKNESELLQKQRENYTFIPDTNIYEAEDKVVFLVSVPGVSKGDVNIEIDGNNILNIHAKGKQTEPEDIRIRQFTVGDFHRTFKLGSQFDKENVKASLEDGLLKIVIGVKEEAKPKTIAINA